MPRAIPVAMTCLICTAGALALGQTATDDVRPPKNIDRALEATLPAFDVEQKTLKEVFTALRTQTDTNVQPNWNALTAAGVTRDTPITLHLKDATYEEVVKTLLAILPTKGTRANYSVNENVMFITTEADMGKGPLPKLYSLGKPLAAAGSGKLIESILRAELLRAGEPMDAPGHDISVNGEALAATVSPRAHSVIAQALRMLKLPTAPGQLAPGTALTGVGKKTLATLSALKPAPTEQLFLALARHHDLYQPQVNLAFLPGTREELEKPAPEFDGTITAGGVVLVGPASAIAARTVMGTYDIRSPARLFAVASKIKPLPPVEEQQATLLKVLLEKSPLPGGHETWGAAPDLGKSPSVIIPIQGMIVVFARPEIHRQLTRTLMELNR